MPKIIYGCAWKKERTTDLVIEAINCGFRGIDTACQPKHYNEAGVGEALTYVIQKGIVNRKDIFLQTKFTSMDGQDQSQPLPYDPHAELSLQVEQSFASSLRNLQTDYIDCLLLHSPMHTHEKTMIVWRSMERLFDSGKVHRLGISNMYSATAFAQLYADARIPPSVIQNRFYHKFDFDKGIRQFCHDHDVVYESFWTLTGNPNLVQSSTVKVLAAQYQVSCEQLWFRFVMALGIVPLSGTTNLQHMKEDLRVPDIPLSSSDVQKLTSLLGH
jgi:diketogulonate reductase-like aldo/keto reductase